MTPARRFPVLHEGRNRRAHPTCPASVPWSLVEGHEAQAWRNHHQSLERLAERGGLCPVELQAVVTDTPYPRDERSHSEKLRDAVAWLAAPGRAD